MVEASQDQGLLKEFMHRLKGKGQTLLVKFDLKYQKTAHSLVYVIWEKLLSHF